MRTKMMAAIVTLTLLMSAGGMAQNYNLGWDDVNQKGATPSSPYELGWSQTENHVEKSTSGPEDVALVVRQEKPSNPQVVAPRRMATQAKNRDKGLWAPKSYVTFSASEFYNAYAEKMVPVERVELRILGKKGYRYDTFFNMGELRNYVFYINALSPGDSYRALVVWKDGSNRTVENTLRSAGESRVWVDQPYMLASRISWP